MALQDYHLAWLGFHLGRTEEWLQDKLNDGFQVHHVDGDTLNNDPVNLVLIDGADHLAIHNGSVKLRKKPAIRSHRGEARRRDAKARFALGKQAYKLYESAARSKSRRSRGWADHAKPLGVSWHAARSAAQFYANLTDQVWPPGSVKPEGDVKERQSHCLGVGPRGKLVILSDPGGGSERLETGRKIYNSFCARGRNQEKCAYRWGKVAEQYVVNVAFAKAVAKEYAASSGKPWPPA